MSPTIVLKSHNKHAYREVLRQGLSFTTCRHASASRVPGSMNPENSIAERAKENSIMISTNNSSGTDVPVARHNAIHMNLQCPARGFLGIASDKLYVQKQFEPYSLYQFEIVQLSDISVHKEVHRQGNLKDTFVERLSSCRLDHPWCHDEIFENHM